MPRYQRRYTRKRYSAVRRTGRRYGTFRRRNVRRTQATSVRRIVMNMAEKKRTYFLLANDNVNFNQVQSYYKAEMTPQILAGTAQTNRIGNHVTGTSSIMRITVINQSEDGDTPIDRLIRIIIFSPKDDNDVVNFAPGIVLDAGIDVPQNVQDFAKNWNSRVDTENVTLRKDIRMTLGSTLQGDKPYTYKTTFRMPHCKGDWKYSTATDPLPNNLPKRTFIMILVCTFSTASDTILGVQLHNQFNYIDL